MMIYTERNEYEKALIKKAYDFEIEAIENIDCSTNPYLEEILSLADGELLWKAIGTAVELAYN